MQLKNMEYRLLEEKYYSYLIISRMLIIKKLK
nr:MAG TPA: hypothetical protein [Caudoviricetes sp.]